MSRLVCRRRGLSEADGTRDTENVSMTWLDRNCGFEVASHTKGNLGMTTPSVARQLMVK